MLLFLFQPVHSQSKIELVIPEGISSGNLATVKSNKLTQLALYENKSNKIIVWDLELSKQKYNLKLSSEIRSLAYDKADKYLYASTIDSVYIVDSESGNIINQRVGTNYILNNFSAFLDNNFVYVKDNDIHLANILSQENKKIELTEVDNYPVSVSYNSDCELLFVFNADFSISLYKKDLSFYGKLSISDYYNEIYSFENNIITIKSSGTSIDFRTYDLKSLQIKKEFSITEKGDYPSFHNKSKTYIDHHEDKVFLYEDNHILINDVTTGKVIKSIPLKIDEVHNIVLSDDKKNLLIYGMKPEAYNERELLVYDLTTYSLKQFNNPIESEDSWSYTTIFDDENFFVYRFTENQISKNSIQTGKLINNFNSFGNKKISTNPSKPLVIKDKILLVLDDENYKKTVACIDLKTNTLKWNFEDTEDGYFTLKVDDEVLTVINEGYPNNTYTVLDIETGKKIFQTKSEEKFNIFPLNKNRILTISNFQGGDWKNTIYELHITEHILSENKSTLHKISLESGTWPTDILAVENYLYVKFSDKLLTFSSNDLSKYIAYIPLDMQDCRLIDVYNNEYLYVYDFKNEKTFRTYNLTDKKQVQEGEKLFFVSHNKPLNQVLLKNVKDDLYLFDIATQKLTTTQVNLANTKEIKIFHDKWLVYKNEGNESIYDLKSNKLKQKLSGSAAIESLTKDGNIYFEHDKLKYSKNGADFVSLADHVMLPDNASDFSFGAGSDEIVYFDNKGLLNFLNLSEKKINSFQPFSSSSYDIKYEKLSPHLYLVSNNENYANKQYKIIDTKSRKTTNLSENAFQITDFETNNEHLIITESNNVLKIFNINNASQLFEANSFSYKLLNDNLVVFDDSKKILLYSIKTNRILWESEIKRKNYKSYFSTILDDTVLVVNEDEIFALDVRNGNVKARHPLLSRVSIFYSDPIDVDIQTKRILINIGNDFEAKYQILEYKNNEFVQSNTKTPNHINLQELKTEYGIEDNDLFSLNNTILAVYKYSTKVFSVYDTESKRTLFDQKVTTDNSSFSWDVLEAEKQIFAYDSSGNILLVDYGTNFSREYKVDGDRFRTHKNLLYVSNYGKKIDVYEFGTAQELTKLYSFVPMPNKQYMFYTDNGYYISTKEAAKNLQFKLNKNLYSFEQFDLIYNRPDLVLKQMKSTNTELIKMYEKAYEKRIKRQNYTVSTFTDDAPKVEITNKSILFETDKNLLPVQIKAASKQDKLSKIVIKVNDNLYKEITVSSKSFTATEDIMLNEGSNTVEVYAINSKNIKGISDKTDIFYKTKERKSPKVYFFGIGVSEYKNEKFNLKYASKDIQDMVKALSERYPNIDINLLLNKDVTSENIKNFKQKLSQTKTDDLVIISFCGHGVLDKDYNWYFATHDIDFNKPENSGFSYDNLTALTNNIQSRQKLITIDACHSGEIDSEEVISDNQNVNHHNLQKDEEKAEGKVTATKRGAIPIKTTKDGGKTSFELMKQMFSELESSNGTIVISASGGMEYAFEGGTYKNGVFTYSILDLLYNSVWNTLKISELQKTVIEKVENLTEGKQQPNVRTGTLNYDWIVW